MRKTNPVYFLQLCSTHLTLPWLTLYALMSNYLQFIDKHFHFPSFVFFFFLVISKAECFFLSMSVSNLPGFFTRLLILYLDN